MTTIFDKELKDCFDDGSWLDDPDESIPWWLKLGQHQRDSEKGPGPFDDVSDVEETNHSAAGSLEERSFDVLRELAERAVEPDKPHRVTYYCDLDELKESSGYRGSKDERRFPIKARHANLLSSETPDGRHAPVIDIDMECRVVPSRTKGHYHFYIDKPIAWWRYRLMLKAMTIAGIVEPGYYKASVRRRMTFVRWTLLSEWQRSKNAKAMMLAELVEMNEELHR